jgi:hypothetical protein
MELLSTAGLEPQVHLLRLVSVAELTRLCHTAEMELSDPSRWGTTFTLIQTWAKVGS